uniref:CABIT domain-containing protein n=1 Tax=Romanomermis culicivorax TaxID=13658 RepID=A0A915IV03_ROMCU
MNSNNKHLSSSWSFLQSIKFMIDDDQQLLDFVRHRSVPHLALITKGHYGTTLVGAPDAENPFLQPYFYLHCKRVVKKLAGQLIRTSKDGKSLLSVTNLIVSVSDLFKGYFEILSEDGQPVTPKCIESVAELTDLFPEQILIRKECKCYIPDTIDGELKHSDPRMSYNCETLKAGTILTLVGRFHAKKQNFLRCYVDETGQSVFLKMSQKIKCSQIAQNAEIAGIHDTASLLQKRLPLTVRLVFGPITEGLMEACARNNYHINSDGSGLVIRLRKSYRDQIIFGYSIRKPEGKIVALPLKTDLRLAPVSTNQQNHVMEHYDLRRLSKMCDDYLSIYADRINLIDQDEYLSHDQMQPSLRQKSVERKKLEKHRKSVGPMLNGKSNTNSNGKIYDEEIEQLYDYVRGLTPKKETQKKNHAPPPPPISTIPNRTLTRMNEMDNETYATSRSAPENPNVDASLGIARVFKTAEAVKENNVSSSNNNPRRKNVYKSPNKMTPKKSPTSKIRNLPFLTASMNDLQSPSRRRMTTDVEDDFFYDSSPANHIYRKKPPTTNQNKRRPFSLSIPEISAATTPHPPTLRYRSPPNNDALRRSFVTLVTLDDKMIDIQNNVDRSRMAVSPAVKPMHIWATTIPPVAAYPYFPNGTKYVHCAPFLGAGQMGY